MTNGQIALFALLAAPLICAACALTWRRAYACGVRSGQANAAAAVAVLAPARALVAEVGNLVAWSDAAAAGLPTSPLIVDPIANTAQELAAALARAGS